MPRLPSRVLVESDDGDRVWVVERLPDGECDVHFGVPTNARIALYEGGERQTAPSISVVPLPGRGKEYRKDLRLSIRELSCKQPVLFHRAVAFAWCLGEGVEVHVPACEAGAVEPWPHGPEGVTWAALKPFDVEHGGKRVDDGVFVEKMRWVTKERNHAIEAVRRREAAEERKQKRAQEEEDRKRKREAMLAERRERAAKRRRER